MPSIGQLKRRYRAIIAVLLVTNLAESHRTFKWDVSIGASDRWADGTIRHCHMHPIISLSDGFGAARLLAGGLQ
jgi:hypothetical protein